jgi:hypothetical protein
MMTACGYYFVRSRNCFLTVVSSKADNIFETSSTTI